MREGWIERDGVRLHLVEWGEPDAVPPAVLLLHGLSSNARFWDRLAAALPNRRLVALDQRSHGLSDRPAHGYRTEDLVEDAATAIASQGMGRPVVAGHSWGASTALALSAGRPDLVAGLAFVDAGLTSMSSRMTREEALSMMEPDLPRHADLAAAVVTAQSFLGPAWGEDLMPYVEAGMRPDGESFVPTLTAPVRRQILLEMFDLVPEDLWPRVRGPILAALAAQSWEPFLVAKREGAQKLRELRPDALIRWYDSPHDIPVVKPAELARDLDRLCEVVARRGYD